MLILAIGFFFLVDGFLLTKSSKLMVIIQDVMTMTQLLGLNESTSMMKLIDGKVG